MNREDFPLIEAAGSVKADCCLDPRDKGNREGLVYFDNAATMQKPRQVIEAVRKFYEYENATPLRGVYDLSVGATEKIDAVREKVARFVGADADEIIFTSGATEGLNMVAMWCGRLTFDDEIVIGEGEHHSNILPWARVSQMTEARMSFAECGPDGTVDYDDFVRKLTPNTKIVALNYIGNVYGGENRIKDLFKVAHERCPEAICVLDAAQAVAHRKVDVRILGADAMAFSGHKMGAPMGTGALYMRGDLMRWLEPIEYGGGMVDEVGLRPQGVFTRFPRTPRRFEAGTPNMEGIVGLGAAIDYITGVGYGKIKKYEAELTEYMMEELEKVAKVYGGGNGIVAFNVPGIHPHDVAEILNEEGIAVRAGWHCAQPLLEALGTGPVVRASLAFYNTKEEIDKMIKVLLEARKKMGLEK